MRTYKPNDLVRLMAKTVVGENGCWIWTGGQRGEGYGNIRFQGKGMAPHRMSYELWIGPIPDGLTIDHLCRNRLCVNPDHLEPVTMAENIRRGAHACGGTPLLNRLKTHCKRGHEFTDENTCRDKVGRRRCKECNRIHSKARYYCQKAI